MKKDDNKKVRNRGTNKRVRVRREGHRKVMQHRHRKNHERKLSEQVCRPTGLFIALIKERGFVRYEHNPKVWFKRPDNGDVQVILVDYIKDKAALLLAGSNEYEDPEVQYVLYYEEQPLAQVTVTWLARQQEAKRVRTKIRKWEKEAPRRSTPGWKQALSSLRKEG